MKYRDPVKRRKQETKNLVLDPSSRQMFYSHADVQSRQDTIELRIKQYQEQGRRLTKQMRSYLKSKERSNA